MWTSQCHLDVKELATLSVTCQVHLSYRCTLAMHCVFAPLESLYDEYGLSLTWYLTWLPGGVYCIWRTVCDHQELEISSLTNSSPALNVAKERNKHFLSHTLQHAEMLFLWLCHLVWKLFSLAVSSCLKPCYNTYKADRIVKVLTVIECSDHHVSFFNK